MAGNGGSTVYTALAYDSLIHLSNDGKLEPDLAESWKYVGTGNKVFELTLRSGVKFTDGKPLTADAAVASMQYFLKAGGPLVPSVGAIDKVEATGPLTVRVTYKQPNPDAAGTMEQYHGIGTLIGPDGLANPQSLLTKSDGTGAYAYDNAGSVAGSRYSYTKNPNYFNPKAQRFSKVSVRVIGDPQAVLSAVRTGQVDYASGNDSTADAAKAAGLKIVKAPFFNWELILGDTKGTISKPLADPRVRQAIGYAINRDALSKAFNADFTKPSTQQLIEGADGYDQSIGYTYDLQKAKSLMAAAGYSKGFPLEILTESVLDRNTTYSQAIADALKAIGITVKLKVISTTVPQFIGEATSKKYAAAIWPSAGPNMFQNYSQVSGGLFNPFGHQDAQLDGIMQRASAADGSERTGLYQQASKRFQELAWLIPVIATENVYYVNSKLEGVSASVGNPNPMPIGPTPDLSWRKA
ncbi:ABC transporter substrate-binding protein [Cryptosporangium phraense]|uniref:ABC transporter substrate-binding protein n=1 Tax=Cryptosporangium phraense TaxID=2593070 RepID=A0A545AIQ1_9ACTN|nr:ABC transporter substrate-binding protein [Cryptosporangium phraense]